MRRLLSLFGVAAIIFTMDGARADPPSIVLTYPASNTIVDQALTRLVHLRVAVSDPDDTIAGVTYFACVAISTSCSGPSAAIGVSQSPPFDFLWLPQPVLVTGEVVPYLLWAEAVNASGQSASSNISSFLIDQPPLPTGSLVAPSPALNHEFVVPAAPMFYAKATPLPSTVIARVDFLDNEQVIGSLDASNAVPNGYAFVWRDAPVGAHLISARVIDSAGNSATSTPVSIYVADADEPPHVALTSPATGQTYASGDAIPLAAIATSDHRAIERVEFRLGETIIATSRSAPYTAFWGGPTIGNIAIVAVAFDDLGMAVSSAPAYVTVLEAPRAPAVALTAPASGSTISVTGPITLTADALSPEGTIARVDFYAGDTLLGGTAASPYTFIWVNPQVGSQSFKAKAYDLRNVATLSAPVTVDLTSKLVPTLILTSPANAGTFSAPASFTVSADASEPGGSIAKVDFYANGNPIGTKSAPPYSVTWSNVSAGGYTISAKATDATGATANSANVSITVYPPTPTAVLSAPLAGTRYGLGQPISLAAQVTTPGSTILKVEFDSDGVPIGTVNAPGGASSGNFTLSWSGATAGTHTFAAKAFPATGGTITSAPVSVTISDLSVVLSEPANGQVFQPSSPIPLGANASETGIQIARVEYYADGTLIASSSTAPYAAAWNAAAPGSHSLAARVFDRSGLTATSPSVTVTVTSTPIVRVDAGIDGGTIADDYATISGSIQAPLNSAIVIDGRHAVLDLNGRFFVDDFKIQSGANAITLTLNAQGSNPVVKTINLSSSGVAPFEVSLDKQEGLAPLTVDLWIKNRGNVVFKRITVDTTDDGVPDFVLAGLSPGGTSQSITYGAPGLYTIRIVAYGADDSPIYTAMRRVRAIDPSEIGYKVASVYTALVNNLAANNVNAALSAFVDGARERYANVFADLATTLSTVATQLGSLTNISLNEDMAELTIARPVGSDTQLFMIYLIRGNDGLWRIETM